MIRHFLYIIFFLTYFLNTNAQTNLVPNPSFEIHDTCPDSPGQINYIADWNALLNSPDYYNSCSPSSSFSVPKNFFGYQPASSGNAYAGFWAYDDATPVYRELIGASLISPLVIGQKYYISFKVNLSLDYVSNSGCDKIGLRFTNVQHSLSNPPLINNMADVYTTSIITDTTNWTAVFGSFLADSAYSFIEMGNFFDNSHTNFQPVWSQVSNESYYYIDDVCISTDSLYTTNWTSIHDYAAQKTLTIYPNPSIDGYFYSSINFTNQTINIYDLLGNSVKKLYVTSNSFNLSDLENGIYLIEINTQQYKANEKLIIQKQ